jgi:ABC-type dipeptide/oligopeptide/nickel transport system permease component
MNLRRFLLRRFFLSVVTLFGAMVAVFVLTHVLPGNPAKYRAGAFAPAEAVAEIEREMGLDKPLVAQFGRYLKGLLHGDLGRSWSTRRPVAEDLAQRLPATLELAVASFLLAILIALPLGIVAAVKKGSFVDHLCRILTTFSSSVALFWLGTMLIYVIYYEWRWAAAPTGRLDVGLSPPETITGFYVLDSLLTGNMKSLGSSLKHLFLPSVTLSFAVIGIIAKGARTSMLEVLRMDYIRTASALGKTRWQVVVEDGLQNALIPVVTILALVFGFLMAGNIIVEMLFAWPGIGQYAWNALLTKDFDSIQGFMLFTATLYVFLNLLADVLYGLIDPRIRLGVYGKGV